MSTLQYPSWQAGQRVTAAALTQMEALYAIKNAATSRSSNTTLAIDPDLQIALPSAGTFVFEAWINYTGGTLGSSDLKIAPVFGGTTSWAWWGISGSTTGSINQVNQTADGIGTSTAKAIGTSGGAFLSAQISGSISASSAGTLSLYWAQNTSSATSTNLRQGCWLRAFQIA